MSNGFRAECVFSRSPISCSSISTVCLDAMHLSLWIDESSGYYGAKSLVNEYSASVVASIHKFHREDIRVQLFGHFLSEFWDAGTLHVFLRGFGKLLEPSRVACIELPTEATK